MNSYMNSYIWIHNILHDHKFISEFIWWIHIRFHDHQFICDISWPMNSYMNSCIWRISWNHTWIHVYQGSRWTHTLDSDNLNSRHDFSFTGFVRRPGVADRDVSGLKKHIPLGSNYPVSSTVTLILVDQQPEGHTTWNYVWRQHLCKQQSMGLGQDKTHC